MVELFRHILVPTDGSEASIRAARLAFRLVRAQGGRLTFVFVLSSQVLCELIRFEQRSEAEAKAELLSHGQRYLALLQREAACEGIGAGTLIRQGSPCVEIAATAKDLGCDLIVIGHQRRRGSRRLITGSLTECVLQHSPCPVLVALG